MKILAYTSPARGELFPIVRSLRELRQRGHEVAVRTLPEHLADLAAIGLEAKPLSPEVAGIALEDWQAPSPQEAQARAMQGFGKRAPPEVADLRRAVAEERPDLLLANIMAFGAMAAAEASGLPWASWIASPPWLRGEGLPPYGPGLPPLPGPEGRARDEAIARMAAGPARNVVAAVNLGRRAAGLAPIADPDDLLLKPSLLLVMTAEPFEYPRRSWPGSILLVGPCAWEPPSAAPAWLAEDRRPIVLVSTSSEFQDDGRLVSTALAALRGRDDILVVATVPAGDPSHYECPPNARIERFLPHGHVLPRALAVICHAGMGVTQKALAAGVPVCAVPFGRDQLEVARRVAVAGAGARLAASELAPESLRAALDRTIACRAGAERIAKAFAAAPGPEGAARAIERLVSGRNDAHARETHSHLIFR